MEFFTVHFAISVRFVGLALVGAVALGQAQGGPISPAESFKKFTVFDDLEIDQLLAEPLVKQPVFLNFDERGRMWVVQYRQYPSPAGLKMTSRDNYWRAVYDKVPPAPPNHIRGRDKITIHEDTDGDGVFDKHKTFLDGLNIVTSLAHGRGGVWVINPHSTAVNYYIFPAAQCQISRSPHSTEKSAKVA